MGTILPCNILSIDAWREPEGWFWNAWYKVGVFDLSEKDTTRTILKDLRTMGFLSDYSKGRLTIEDDQYNLVIINRNTRQPIFAIEYGVFN